MERTRIVLGNKTSRDVMVARLTSVLRLAALFGARQRARCAEVYLPDALARKWPSATREWAWQYLFPAPEPSRVLGCRVHVVPREKRLPLGANHHEPIHAL